MLDTRTIQIVKSTIPLLEGAGTAVTDHFYQRMFTANPELKDIFNLSNQKSGRQQFALFSAVAAYAKYIDNLAELGDLVERIAQKHTSFDIQPEQYQIVGHHLIETLRELAPDEFTDDVAEAWIKAYQLLATVLIDREKALYQYSREEQGGWTGPRAFRVKDKNKESELVTSFIFEPVDGQPIRQYQPGQYIAVRVKPDNAEHVEIRQYSLSDKYHPDHYRISVKRERSPIKGMVSNHLHDEVEVGDTVELMPPAGAFFLTQPSRPVMLISGGVGLTPMMSMLETLVSDEAYQHDIFFLHTCKNAQQHSFKQRLAALKMTRPNLHEFYWYSEETHVSDDINLGLMDINLLRDIVDFNNVDVYLCGPLEFMRFVRLQLHVNGVPSERIHFETFGPHDEII
ncbi:hemoglobin-like flavoprotein [Methylophaga aminisulfidivorans MP]|uniref:Flavohemoprotein n=1 Tax=Methylophaga aminisulfidivorans MP TaxID=1026882 RepID=F5SW36_9GAMM|nr:NO-inducible flavohemoprotein [Methylophaga aminisulfidivorans]EGL55757.1 hemoglobin-like flavoprotein [Methylophaga aminisulfidivorans MP]